MSAARAYDLIVYGATGYTGRLVAEFINTTHPGGPGLKWAIAGRSKEKLAEVAGELGLPASVGHIAADASDPASLKAMAEQAKTIITTVGPYQLYGEPLIAAVVAAGTGYTDLCGEPAWMRQMIDKYGAEAQRTGARILFSCGFDSIPFDLGVLRLQALAKAKFGKPAPRVKGRVRAMKGKFSGGTAASMGATLAAAKDPAVAALLRTPFALTPGFEGPDQPSGMVPELDPAIGQWVAPFIMAPINTRNVHRTNLLLGHSMGKDLVYDEMMVTGPGQKGEEIAKAMAAQKGFGPGPLPKPGEGPTPEERATGYYDVLFIGEMPDGKTIKLGVTGKRDPGYGATCKMITCAALCLNDAPHVKGGFWTPGAALGDALITRLEQQAEMTFTPED